MRVVSQNRNYSFDFERTIFWTQYNIIYARVGIDNIQIGQYESDERAGKVFEDIHKVYSGMPILFENVDITEDMAQEFGKRNINAILTKSLDDSVKIETIDNTVYYMPEV